MDMRKIAERDNTLELLVKGTNATMMNSLRRAAMNAVPALAIEDIAIYNNTSVLFDEFLGHRLAMVPLRADGKRYKVGDKARLTLDKEGPCTVYSKDLVCTDPNMEVVDKRIPIVKLKKGQKVKLEADAVMGRGKEHAKWQPAIVSYNHLPTISAGSECNLCKHCVDACARNALEVKAKKIVLKDPLACNLCGKCRDVCEKKQLNMGYDKGSFVLRVESHGAIGARDVLLKASEALREKAAELKAEVKKLKKSDKG